MLFALVAAPVAMAEKEPPVPIRVVQPEYPFEQHRAGISGVVTVKCTIDEHGDRVRQQIIGVFPTFAMQRTNNVLAIRQFLPTEIDSTDLNWVYLGYEDDTPDLRKRRLKQLNLAGPAGFVSMEDGCIGNFVERGAAAAPEALSLLEMGGDSVESQDTRATETAVRGFWQMWRRLMGL